jgi:hypothetical protein
MIQWRWLAGLLLAAAAVCTTGAQEQPLGAPQPDRTLRDPEFGVTARHLGLERQVEMLQWQTADTIGFRKVWSPVAIDSSRFPPGHDNPGVMPLQGRRWLAREVTIDGKPVDPAVLRMLGEWRPFRPAFSALPGNMSATFQPEGTGLGSAENPLRPVIGDLRIHWRDLVLPPLDGRVTLRDGRWVLTPPVAPDPAQLAADARSPEGAGVMWSRGWWLGGIVVILLALAGVVAVRRRRR